MGVGNGNVTTYCLPRYTPYREGQRQGRQRMECTALTLLKSTVGCYAGLDLVGLSLQVFTLPVPQDKTYMVHIPLMLSM